MNKFPNLVSIIMLTRNSLDYTKQCLVSLKSNTFFPYELIIVDNASNDGTPEYLESLDKYFNNTRVKVIFNSENRGFGPANNQGIKEAKGDIILFLNNDVVLTKGWLKKLAAHFEKSLAHNTGSPVVRPLGALGPMTNSCRGDQQVSLKPYKGLDEMEKYAQIRSEKFMGMTQNYDRLVGFCLAVTKEALDKTGGFDEQFITGNYEDEDLCMRIAQKGYALKIALDVFIHHWGSITFKNNNMDYDQLKKDNQKRFIKKWGRLRYLFLRLKNSKTVKKWINSINKRWSIS